jgi:flagellar biosynthesis protein FlhF
MKMQKFEADSMPEALHKVKAALGPDAIIMDTRSTRKPGKLGLRARDRVQVWAAQSLEDAGLKPAGLGAAPGVVGYAPAAEGHLDTGLLTALHARLGDLESKLDLLATAAAYGSGSWARGYTAAELSDEQRAAGLAALARRVAVSGEIALASARVVALVGPTGAGKTLTAAKLAGRFALTHGARVGVICADGFRVGGMTEMQGYCDLLGVPMAQARDEQEMRAAIASHGECDLILIDTPGVSPRSDQQLA